MAERPTSFLLAAAAYAATGFWMESQTMSLTQEFVLVVATALVAGLLQYLLVLRVLGSDGGLLRVTLIAPLIALLAHMLIFAASLIALLILILPGLYLAGRLSATTGIIVKEGAGVAQAMYQSWRRTRASAWSLTLVQLLLLLPTAAVMALTILALVMAFGTQSWEESSTELAVLTNVIWALAALASWAVAIATYRLTAYRTVEHEADVFA